MMWEFTGNNMTGNSTGVGMLYTSLKVGFPYMYTFFKSERMQTFKVFHLYKAFVKSKVTTTEANIKLHLIVVY